MTITKDMKSQVITDNRTHGGDTGSPEIQVALLTQRILDLNSHFEKHETEL